MSLNKVNTQTREGKSKSFGFQRLKKNFSLINASSKTGGKNDNRNCQIILTGEILNLIISSVFFYIIYIMLQYWLENEGFSSEKL